MPDKNLEPALSEYFRREAAAMETPRGADVAELLEQVAAEHGVETDVLTEAMLDASIAGAN